MDAGEKAKLEARRASGARWFVTVGLLSIVNSVFNAFGSHLAFVFGLGLTQIFDALRTDPMFGKLTWFALVFSVGAVFAHLGRLARRGRSWAWVTGLVLYGVDGLLFVLARQWLGLALHLFAGVGMVMGYRAHRALRTFETPAS